MTKFRCSQLIVASLMLWAVPCTHSYAQDSEEAPAPSEGSALETVKDKAKEWVGTAHQLSREHLAGSTVVVGIGRATPTGKAKDFGNSAVQWGFQANREMFSILDNLSLKMAFDVRYSKHTKTLEAVRVGNTSAKSTLKRYDYSLLIGLHYGVIENFALFAEIGPSVQQRSLWIDADSGGDYYNNTSFGYLGRLGAQYYLPTSFGNFVTNLFYSMSNGGSKESGRLKYNLERVNYNGPTSAFGVELGLTL